MTVRTHTMAALMALNYMIHGQIRHWFVQPKLEKKKTVDQSALDAGYKFIRDMGPKANSLNRFIDRTDTQIHTAGSPIEGILCVYNYAFLFSRNNPDDQYQNKQQQ